MSKIIQLKTRMTLAALGKN